MQLILISYYSVLILCSLSKGQQKEYADNAEECYISARNSPRIIGGIDAREAEFPFAVSFQTIDDDHEVFCNFCGGTILTNKLILTAAHCIGPRFASAKYTRIVVGTIDLEKIEDEQIYFVEAVYKHSDSNNTTKLNDYAIVVITPPLKFTKHVQAVHLPTQGREPPIGSKCTAIGWGRTSLGGPRARILQKVELTIEDRNECRKFLNSSGNATSIINMLTLCTFDINKSTAKGDSGSAIMCKDPDGHLYIGGIASRARNQCGNPSCTVRKHLNVFTNVGQFYCHTRHYIMSIGTEYNGASASVETNLNPPSKKICRSSNRNKTYHLSPKQYGVAVRQCLQNESPCNPTIPRQCCTGYCRYIAARGVICTILKQDDPRGDPANDAFEIFYFLSEHFLEYKGWLGAIWWEFNSKPWLKIDDADEITHEEIINTYRYMSDTDTCCVPDMYVLETKFQKCLRIEHKMILLVNHDYIDIPRASYIFQTTKGMAILITNGTQVDILKGWNIASYWKERMSKNNR